MGPSWRKSGLRTACGSLAAVLIACAVVGCSTTTVVVAPEEVRPPPGPFTAVAVGEMAAGPERWKRLSRFLRAGLVQGLVDSQAFETVLAPAPKDPPPNAIVVTGRITDVDDGSEASRMLIGLGVGRAEVAGRFEIVTAGGERLAAFEQRQASSDGTGQAAHWNPVSVEALIERLGAATAQTIVRWRDGEDLQAAE